MVLRKDIKVLSLQDSYGSVFLYDGRVFRGFYPEFENTVNDILQSQWFRELMTDGKFPKTWISDIEFEGFPLVLEHERIKCIPPVAWTFSQLCDSAVFTAELLEHIKKSGAHCPDLAIYNITIKGKRFIFFDFSSFIFYDSDNEGIIRLFLTNRPTFTFIFESGLLGRALLNRNFFYSNLDEKLSRKLRTRALYEHFSYKHSAVRGFLCTMFVKAIGIFDHYFFDNVLCSAFNTLFSTSWMKDKLSLPANVDKSLTSVVTPPGNLVELDPECHIISINVSPSLLQQHFDYAGHSGEITFLYSDQSLADDSYRAFKQESISHDVFWYNLLNPLFDVSEVFGKRTVFYRLEFQCKAFLPGIIQRLLSFTDERLVIILDSSTPDIDAVSETVKQELSYYCSDISTSASDFGISLSCRILTALR